MTPPIPTMPLPGRRKGTLRRRHDNDIRDAMVYFTMLRACRLNFGHIFGEDPCS